MPSLALFVLLVAAAAFTGSRFPPGEWYAGLAKPSFNPPSWVFGPVWTLLYLGIAVAGWLVHRKGGRAATPALAFWGAQLVLNALWSYLFFGLHRPGLALVEIVVLLAAIGGFVFLARPLSRAAAGLFVPYALWVSFATILNAALWRLNPGR